MKRILIDVGNTRVKAVLAEDAVLLGRRSLPTRELSASRIREVLGDWMTPLPRVVLCSVVPRTNAAFQEAFADQLLIVTHETPLGVGIDYPEPASIGPDRLVNAVALAELYGKPGIVVDFGTAVTFDVLSDAGNYTGGVIAPGVEMMNDYMCERTALLPRIDLIKDPPVLGRSTVGAMQSGAFYGYAGMVRRILDELLQTFSRPGSAALVATGGAGALFHDELGIQAYDPDLTLHGLRLIDAYQSS